MDNKMIIRCRSCGEEMVLGNYMSRLGWFFGKGFEEKGEELAMFLIKHGGCYMDIENPSSESPLYKDISAHPFELVFEDKDV